ncbi:unnamed protein product [Blepharisma stoltei]|uniref:Uncharacterized protein n=1 Tax=Blepharisma stoltei TaxID=1481888 RepID=A0AAU9KD83_9CILI|nr:unnamed protein product [Blepharisma stoltei]
MLADISKEKIISSPSINKYEKEIIVLEQNNKSFRFDDVAKIINKVSAKNSKIKKKKSLSLRNINDINLINTYKGQTSSKKWNKNLSIKSSRTDRVCSKTNNFAAALRIHSLSTPSSIIENSPQYNPVFISPRIRPHSVFIQNFSGKIESQCKYEKAVAPFCVSVRGTKVKECDSYGIMFRPSTACSNKSSIPVSATTIKRAIYSHRIK